MDMETISGAAGRVFFTAFTEASRLTFEQVDLSQLDLRAAELNGAVVRRSSLRQVRLAGARAEAAVFADSDLRGADLSEAELRGVRFERCSLDGADLTGADLRNAVLEACQLDGADFTGAVRLATDPPLPGYEVDPDAEEEVEGAVVLRRVRV